MDAAATERIAARYEGGTRLRVVSLLIGLGAALLGAGLIWLVASNLDIEAIGPLERFLGVAVIWLGLVAAGEACAAAGERWAVGAGPLRALAVLAYGATVFQAAQSLQVPAYEPSLLGAWALGGLLYAYATGSAQALVPSVVAAAGWYAWALGARADDGVSVVVGFALAVPVCVAAAALHEGRAAPAGFAGPWRALGGLLGFVAFFTAALPDAASGDLGLSTAVVLGLAAAAAATAAALARGAPERRDEVLGAFAFALVAGALIALAPADLPSFGDERPTGAQAAYTVVATVAFLAWSVGVALAGAAREAPGLVNLAFAALLVFVAVQSFGIIAALASGAAVLLAVGALLVAAGVLLDRGRRRLLREASA